MSWWYVAVAAAAGGAVGALCDQVLRRATRRELAVARAGSALPPAPLDRHLAGRGPRVLLVPSLGAAAAAGVAARVGADPAAVPFVVLMGVFAALAVVDAHSSRLPNVLVVRAVPVAAVLIGIVAVVQREPARLVAGILGGLLVFLPLLAFALLRSDSLGMGDVKLAGLLGMVLGCIALALPWLGMAIGLVGSFVSGVAGVLSGRLSWQSRVPLGPWLVAGALAAVVVQPQGIAAIIAAVR